MQTSTNIQQPPSINDTLLNPLNSSKSKFQYSFKKAGRFDKFNKELESYKYYDKPSTNKTKAIKFSTSKKGIFNYNSKTPSSTKYNPICSDDFDFYAKSSTEGKHKKGYSFTTGRQDAISNSFIQLNKNPGPGDYEPDPEIVLNSSIYKGFVMTTDSRFHDQEHRCRTVKSQQSNKKIPVPGPAHYQVKPSLGGENKVLSQDKNNNPCPKFVLATNHSRRISTQPARTIYNPSVTKNGDCTTINKKKGFTIGRSLRADFIKNKGIPGPGKYRTFSEFIIPSVGN